VALKELSLEDNKLSGSLPSSFVKLVKLEKLVLKDNPNLSGNLELSCTAEISIENTKIVLKPCFCSDSSSDCCWVVRSWQLMKNSNSASNDCCSLKGVTCSGSKVTRIVWYHQNLTGSIPPEIGKLRHLELLYLSYNQLSGEVPGSIQMSEHLQVLDFSNNIGLNGTFSSNCDTSVFDDGTNVTLTSCRSMLT